MVHKFFTVVVTATVSSIITYVIVDKQPSFGTSTTTSYVEKAPDSLEAEVCISAESIPTLKNRELIHFGFLLIGFVDKESIHYS